MLALAVAPAGAAGPVAETVSVATILAAYDRAVNADNEPSSIEMTGTLRGEGLSGTFHSWRSGQSERDEEMLGPRTETTLRVGDRVWVRDTNGDVHELHGVLLRQALTSEFIDSGAFVHQPERARFLGYGSLDRKRAWRIEVNADGGDPQTLWIETGSGMLLRSEYVDGDGTTTVDYADWRTIAGQRIAFRTLTSDGTHAFDLVEQTTMVHIDRPIDPQLFAPLVGRQLVADGVQTVPLIAVGGHVGCMVTIGGHSYTFLLDTGAQNILLDSRVAAELGLGEVGSMEVRGAVRAGGLRAARLPELRVGTASLHDLVVSTIDFGGGTMRTEGILGYPFFAAGVVQFDFPHNLLRFGPPGSFAPPGERIDLDVDREVPEATLRLGDLAVPFVIDTGNSGSLLLYQPFVDAHPGIVSTSGETSMNYGVGGSDRTYRVTVDSLALGAYTLTQQPAQVVMAQSGAFADRTDAGNVGLGVLRPYIVTFDLANDAMYLAHFP